MNEGEWQETVVRNNAGNKEGRMIRRQMLIKGGGSSLDKKGIIIYFNRTERLADTQGQTKVK